MSQPLAWAALLLGGAALTLTLTGSGGTSQQAPSAAEPDSELVARIAKLEEELASLQRERPFRAGSANKGASGDPVLVGARIGESDVLGEDSAVDAVAGEDAGISEEVVERLIDRAVAEKASQMQFMAKNKKPTLDAFAKTLKLTEEEREAVAESVLQSQRDIAAILNTPSAEGTVFLDDVVEAFAQGMANPGDKSHWQGVIRRLTTELYPGTDQTYAARVEGVKQELRETFARTWRPESLQTFRQWQMDPTEVQVPGSPWEEVMVRVRERAEVLGAELPPGK